MKSIQNYKNRIARSGDLKTSTTRHTKKSLSFFFKHSPSYEEVRINNKESTEPCQILSGKSSLYSTIVMMPEPLYEINTGDIIERINEHSLSECWLCMDADYTGVYFRGSIEKCNINLKWINEYGIVCSSQSVLKSNNSSSLDEDKILNIPSGSRRISLQYSKETIKIRRDDRFIIGKEAFKVTDIDYITKSGLIELSLISDLINEVDDNLDLGIANYKSKIADYHIKISNNQYSTISIDQSISLNASLYNYNKKVDVQLTYYSDSDSVSVNDLGIVKGQKNGLSNIVIKAQEYSIEIAIQICVKDNKSYNYTAEITGSDLIRSNRQESYQVTFRNNGIIIPDESMFLLQDSDGNNTDLATITQQDTILNTCTIKANTNNKQGIIFLHVKNLNGLSTSKKQINIKSLF